MNRKLVSGRFVAHSEKYPYLGGYNYLTKRGLYGFTMSFDVNSEYPSAIMTANIGKENKIMLADLPIDFREHLFKQVEIFNVFETGKGRHVPIKKMTKSMYSRKGSTFYHHFFDGTGKLKKEKIEEGKRIAVKRGGEYLLIKTDEYRKDDLLSFEFPKSYFNILYRKSSDPLYRDILAATIDLMVTRTIDFGGFLEKYNLSVTPNLMFFKLNKKSVMCVAMNYLYDKRLVAKAHRSNAIDGLNKAKENNDEKNIKYWGEQERVYRTKDLAFKRNLNKGYGAFANAYYKYYDLDVANAITSLSQYYIKSIAKSVTDNFKIMFPDYKDYEPSIYIDTDSVYVNIDPLIQALYKNKVYATNKELINDILVFNEKVAQPIIDTTFKNSSDYINKFEYKMKMKIEKINEAALHVEKKKYVMKTLYDEGKFFTPYKLKTTGLSTKNVSYPVVITKWLEHSVDIIFRNKIDELRGFVEKIRKEFKTMDITQIAQNTKVNKYHKYIKEYSTHNALKNAYKINTYRKLFKDNKIIKKADYVIQPKATPILRGAAYCNYLIRKHNIPTSFIENGDYAYFVYLKANKQFTGKGDTITFRNLEMMKYFVTDIDYDLQFDAFYLSSLNILLGAAGWQLKKTNNFREYF